MAVLAETTAQVLVDDTITLPQRAEKIDEIVARVQDLNCFVIENKVIFQGVLHKQIFFVDTKGFVRHVGVDIPFSGFVDIPGAPAGATCRLTATIEFIDFRLLSPTELRETVVIAIGVTVTDEVNNMTVCSNTLPLEALRFGEPNTVRVKNAGGGVVCR
ncbi:MAG: DUF3794 domain-containing protein [Firmicutes bacterium]|nr:DUF3794 domain-containing protein [Bacillota bacterium]